MGHFDSLEIFDAGVRIPTGAAAGLVAQSDASGNLSWARPGQPAALTGATAATRYVGGTVSGPPVSGTFAVGDFIVDQTSIVWVCTVAGTPGTWQSQAATELGYAEVTSTFQTTSTSFVDVTGWTVTVTAGSRPFDVHAWGENPPNNNTINDGGSLQLLRMDTSAQIGADQFISYAANGPGQNPNMWRRLSLGSGTTITFKVQAKARTGGTVTYGAAADTPLAIQVVQV